MSFRSEELGPEVRITVKPRPTRPGPPAGFIVTDRRSVAVVEFGRPARPAPERPRPIVVSARFDPIEVGPGGLTDAVVTVRNEGGSGNVGARILDPKGNVVYERRFRMPPRGVEAFRARVRAPLSPGEYRYKVEVGYYD